MAVPALAGAAILGGLNSMLSLGSSRLQNEMQRENLDYEMARYYSPQAQVRNLAAAGVNPATAFGNSSPVFSSGGTLSIPQAPQFGIGTTSLGELGSYIKSVSDAKKTGVDTKKSEQEIKNLQVDEDTKRFELSVQKYFSVPEHATSLAQAYKQIQLASDSHDLNIQQKAINEWKQATEKALSECKENERDILKKELDNTDLRLDLANKELQARTEASKAAASASYASADAARTQADVNRQNRRLQAALADVEENVKSTKIDSLIAEYERNEWLSDADAAEARVRAQRLKDVENRRDNNLFFRALDDYSEWLKSKLKIFGK